MALFCRNFAFQEPFGSSKRFFENAKPEETPADASAKPGETADKLFEREVVQAKLTEKTAKKVSQIMTKMREAGKLERGTKTAISLVELQELVDALQTVESKARQGELTSQESDAAKASILSRFEKDFEFTEKDMVVANVLMRQAEERVKLREDSMKTTSTARAAVGTPKENPKPEEEIEPNPDFVRNDEFMTPEERARADAQWKEFQKTGTLAYHDPRSIYVGDRKREAKADYQVSTAPSSAAPAAPEDPAKASAEARREAHEADMSDKHQKYINRAQIELKWNATRNIPEALLNWTDEDYARGLYDLDYGEQLLGALKTMADLAGEPSETEMWLKILKHSSGKKRVSYEGLAFAVLGIVDVSDVLDGYKGMEEELTRDNLSKKRRSELESKKTRREEFFAASMSFMDTVEKLGTRSRESMSTPAEAPANIQKVQGVLDQLFGEGGINKGPLTKPGFFERLFKKAEAHPIDMQRFGGKVEYRSRMEEYISEEAAYTYLMHKALAFNEDTGAAEVTDESLAKFATYLTELRNKGMVDAMADEELADKVNAEKNTYVDIRVDNMESVLTDPMQQELIRRGIAVDLSEEYAKEKMEEQEYLKEAGSPVEQAYLHQILDLTGPLSNKDLHELTKNIHSMYIGTAGFIFNNTDGNGFDLGLGVDLQIPQWTLLDNGKTKIVVSPHYGVKENVISMDTEFHLGAGLGIKHGRFEIRFQAGGQVGVNEGLGIGAATQVGYGLDTYSAYILHGGIGGGMNPGGAATALILSIGLDREMVGVMKKKTEGIRKEKETSLRDGMEAYNAILAAQGYTAGQIQAFEAQMNAMLVEQMGGEAVEKLKKCQFLGAGLVYIPGLTLFGWPFPIPYVKVGFKGKTFIAYNKPEDSPDLANVAEARLREAIAKDAGTPVSKTEWITVYKSGSTMYSVDGSKTIGTAELRKEDLERTDALQAENPNLAKQGIALEKTDLGYRLKISKVNGAVDIYTDPEANLEAVPEDDGFVYIKMHEAEMLSLRRVDEYYPFAHFGNFHRVQIYLSNNIHVGNEVIRGQSNEHIHYKEADGHRTKAETVKDQLDGDRAGFDAGTAPAALSAENLLYGKELEARKGIRTNMEGLLARSKEGSALATADRQAIYSAAEKLLEKDKKNSPRLLEYKNLASAHSFNDVKKFILTQYPQDPSSKPWTNHSLSYMHQSLMMVSLQDHRDKSPEQMAKLILDWNTKRLNEVLLGRGMPAEQAKRISETLMKHMSGAVEEAIEARIKDPGARPLEYVTITEGSVVQIEVAGTAKGYRESFWSQDSQIDRVFDAIDMETDKLTPILGGADAIAFIDAMTGRLSPLDTEKPADLMRSQLGLAVLDSTDIIFTVDEGEKLVQLFAFLSGNPTKSRTEIDAKYNDVYAKYCGIVTKLRQDGEWSDDRVKLTNKRDRNVGFFDKCMNLTFTMNEKITVELKVTQEALINAQTAGAVVRDSLPGRKGVKFVGIGVAVAMAGETEDEPEAEKKGGHKWFDNKPNLEDLTPTKFPHDQTDAPDDIFGE